MRVVTLSPSRPASGESLTEKVMARVGGSIGWAGSGSVDRQVAERVGHGRVLKPAMATMSPASAMSSGTRSRPRKASTLVTRVCSISLPSRLSDLEHGVGLDRARLDAAGQEAAEERIGLERRHQHAERRVGLDRAAPARGARSGRTAAPCPCARPRARSRPSPGGPRRTGSGSRAARRWRRARANRSNTSSCTWCGRASERSTLLISTIGRRPRRSALPSTNLVCGIGPSAASTSSTTPSTIDRMRSTSPPKSAWPGVSTMLMRVPFQTTEVALARMVMPRSRSRSLNPWRARRPAGCRGRCRSASAGSRPGWSCHGRRAR